MRSSSPSEITVPHRHAWLWEPFEGRPAFELRTLFGTKAVYLVGKMLFAFATKVEPWRGMLVCTEREHHASLQAEFPALKPHKVLGKWLYLPERNERFDLVSEQLVRLALKHDPRLGVVPVRKKRGRVSG